MQNLEIDPSHNEPFQLLSLLPFDNAELMELDDFVKTHPFLSMLLDVLGWDLALPAGLGRLRRACEFWSRAEIDWGSSPSPDFRPDDIARLFLEYCTVAEILLGAKTDTAQSIAGRAAGIVGDDAMSRLTMFKEVKDLYDKRSRFVHDGDVLMAFEDLGGIRELVRTCLQYALKWVSWRAIVAEDTDVREAIDEVVQLGERIVADGTHQEDTLKCFFEWACKRFADHDAFLEHCDKLRFGGERLQLSFKWPINEVEDSA
jgi:hypothetical protein